MGTQIDLRDHPPSDDISINLGNYLIKMFTRNLLGIVFSQEQAEAPESGDGGAAGARARSGQLPRVFLPHK